jgi:hypothetical protein
MQLYERLQSRWPDTLLMIDLFESPSIARVARLIDSRTASAHASASAPAAPEPTREAPRSIARTSFPWIEKIETILIRQRLQLLDWQPRTSPRSMVACQNASGGRVPIVWCFQQANEMMALAHALGTDRPLYGMRSGVETMQYSLANVEALAACYANEIATLRPDRPLILGGNCQGARIARSVADRLRQNGRSIPLLILLEEWAFRAYDGPVALLFGQRSHLNPIAAGIDTRAMFDRIYPVGYSVDEVPGAHGEFFTRENVGGLGATVARLVDRVVPAR